MFHHMALIEMLSKVEFEPRRETATLLVDFQKPPTKVGKLASTCRSRKFQGNSPGNLKKIPVILVGPWP